MDKGEEAQHYYNRVLPIIVVYNIVVLLYYKLTPIDFDRSRAISGSYKLTPLVLGNTN